MTVDGTEKLSAILFADIAGYTRLMEVDEAGTYAEWRHARREIVQPTITESGGRLVKFTGDGFLAEFGTAKSALSCAIALQQAFACQTRLKFRMGVHLGDVYVEDGDLYGDGVNVASRLEGFAESGEICISDAVREVVHKNMGVEITDCGEQSLKHIAQPMRVWRITVDTSPPAEPFAASESVPSEVAIVGQRQKPRIAALPFDNLSGDQEQEYFADGLVEDIITELSRIQWLDVIARNSSFTYKGKAVDVRQIGRDLDVSYVLEGSVRKLGPRVRITAQLIEAENGTHNWADRFDGAVEQLFDVLDDVTSGVVGAIEPSLRKSEIERAKRKRPESLDAFDLFLRALAHSYSYTSEGREAARPLLERAISIEPDYAEAHGLAAMLALQSFVWEGRAPTDREVALAHARAVRDAYTDDASALANAAWAFASVGDDQDTAFELIENALARNRNSMDACTWGAFIHLTRWSSEQALALAERAMKLSPLDPQRHLVYHAIGTAKLYLGEVDEALDAAERTLQYNPNYLPAFMNLIVALVRQNRLDEAREALTRFEGAAPGFDLQEFAETFNFIAHIDEIVEAMRAAGMPESSVRLVRRSS